MQQTVHKSNITKHAFKDLCNLYDSEELTSLLQLISPSATKKSIRNEAKLALSRFMRLVVSTWRASCRFFPLPSAAASQDIFCCQRGTLNF